MINNIMHCEAVISFVKLTKNDEITASLFMLKPLFQRNFRAVCKVMTIW